MPGKRGLLVLLTLVLTASAALPWWAARREAELGRSLSAIAKPGDIHMLASTTCAFCAQARAWMTQHRVAFTECFIETDTDCAALYQAARAPGTPVLLVRGRAQVGFSAQRVRDALAG